MNKKLRIVLVLLILCVIILSSVYVIGKTNIYKKNAFSNDYSASYESRLNIGWIGVSLLENGEKIASREYANSSDGSWNEMTGTLLNLEYEDLIPSKTYQEEIAVKNPDGGIDEYVRVSIYRYFTDADGSKAKYVSPNNINLNLCNNDEWLIDSLASTTERTVLYYKRVLPSGEKTPNLIDSIKIDDNVLDAVNFTPQTTSDGKTIITSSKEYEGLKACIAIQVDACQTHSAQDCFMSAWGRAVTIDSNGIVSLK